MTADDRPRQDELQRMATGLVQYVVYFGAVHDEDCPEDDTCDCSKKPLNDAANFACVYLTKQAALPPPAAGLVERLRNTAAACRAAPDNARLVMGDMLEALEEITEESADALEAKDKALSEMTKKARKRK